MMVERKLDGAVDESSADQEICKFDITCEKTGVLHPSRTGSYGRQAVQQAKSGILKACRRSKYSIFHFLA